MEPCICEPFSRGSHHVNLKESKLSSNGECVSGVRDANFPLRMRSPIAKPLIARAIDAGRRRSSFAFGIVAWSVLFADDLDVECGPLQSAALTSPQTHRSCFVCANDPRRSTERTRFRSTHRCGGHLRTDTHDERQVQPCYTPEFYPARHFSTLAR